MTTLIGSRCKYSNVLSRGVLIDRKLHFLHSIQFLSVQTLFRSLELSPEDYLLVIVCSRQAIGIYDVYRLAIVAEWNYLISIPNSEVKHSSAENTWTFGPGKIGHCQDLRIVPHL